MRKILYAIVLASVALIPTGCGSSQTKDDGKSDADSTTSIMTDEGLVFTELKKVPLPCSKETLSAAWKQLNSNETQRRKGLDYRQNPPILFLATDLDGDDCPEILMRGEPPYAAIFTYPNDSLQLITYVDYAQIGLSITPDGVIIRSGSNRDGSFLSKFIKLENSQIALTGEARETFSIQGNEMVSGGTEYLLETDSTKQKVSKEEYERTAPNLNGTYIEDIEGWEDFRKP